MMKQGAEYNIINVYCIRDKDAEINFVFILSLLSYNQHNNIAVILVSIH